MTSPLAVKRAAAPENAKPIKNATRAAVEARTRATSRSNGSSAPRICDPSQKPSSWATITPAIRPNATSSSVICGLPKPEIIQLRLGASILRHRPSGHQALFVTSRGRTSRDELAPVWSKSLSIEAGALPPTILTIETITRHEILHFGISSWLMTGKKLSNVDSVNLLRRPRHGSTLQASLPCLVGLPGRLGGRLLKGPPFLSRKRYATRGAAENEKSLS